MIIITIYIFLSLASLTTLLFFTNSSIYKYSYRVISKFITSSMFILICITSHLYYKNNILYYSLILSGLIFSLLGDLFLAFKPKMILSLDANFLLGILSFSLAHISYILAFNTLKILSLSVILAALILSSIMIIFLKNIKKLNFKSYFIPLYIYSLIICLMFCKGISLYTTDVSICGYIILSLGISLFVISDLILSFILFYKKTPKYFTSLNLITYYIGQILIALSVIFI